MPPKSGRGGSSRGSAGPSARRTDSKEQPRRSQGRSAAAPKAAAAAGAEPVSGAFAWPPPAFTGPTSSVIRSVDGADWCDEGILVPHECLRWWNQQLQRCIEIYDPAQPGRTELLFGFIDRIYIPCVHHHHNAEEEIYNPGIMAKGGTFGGYIKTGHEELLQRLQTLSTFRARIEAGSSTVHEFKQCFRDLVTLMEKHLTEEERDYPKALRECGMTQAEEGALVGQIIQGLGEHTGAFLTAIVYAMCMWKGEEGAVAWLGVLPPPLQEAFHGAWAPQFLQDQLRVFSELQKPAMSERSRAARAPPPEVAPIAAPRAALSADELLAQLLLLGETSPGQLEDVQRRLSDARGGGAAAPQPSFKSASPPTVGASPLLLNADDFAEWERKPVGADERDIGGLTRKGSVMSAVLSGGSMVRTTGTGREFDGLPIQKTPQGIGFDKQKLNEMVREVEESKWNTQPVAIAFQGLKVFSPPADDALPSVDHALTAPFRACCAAKKKEIQRLGHGGGVTGYVRAGQMLLVLGPPSSGCSTLLQTLAGRTRGRVQSRTLMYNGRPSFEDAGARGVYMGEADLHLAPLSVEHTFRMAANLGTPDEWSGIQGFSRDGWNDMLVKCQLHLLSLSHVADTVVGDNLLRGVSGGEKKRVSIGEAQLMRPSAMFLDGWSRGLDSAATLRICRHMRVLTNLLRNTTVVSMYQASPEVLDLFDNVLVLCKGRQLYFGPPRAAEHYFAARGIPRPPRRTLPDFLATVVDAPHDGMSHPRGASYKSADDPAALAAEALRCDILGNEWLQSPEVRELEQRMMGTGGVDVCVGSHLQGITEDTIERPANYVTRREPASVGIQLRWMMWREHELVKANKKQYVNARFGRFIILGVMSGLTYLQLDNDQQGAYSRQGVIYNTMLNLGLASFAAMPDLINQRNTFYKQQDYGMIRPWAWLVTKFLYDIPFSIMETFIYGTVVYWMVGLHKDFLTYLTWLIILWLVDITSASMIRMFTCLAPDLPLAQAMSAGTLILLVFFCGFMIPKNTIPVYYKWAYYMSPFTYGFDALLKNEYYNIDLNCSRSDLLNISIPVPTGDPAHPIQEFPITACTLPTSTPGQYSGKDWIHHKLGIDGDKVWVWYDVLILVGFCFFFLSMNAIILMKVQHSSTGTSLKYKQGRKFAQPDADAASMVTAKGAAKGDREPLLGRDSRVDVEQTQLSWDNVTFSVVDAASATGERKVLLHDICGIARPGQMTALMGPSGAGKTTLMDVLALRKNMSDVEGGIELNGAQLTKENGRVIGYVEQQDMHEPRATVREALEFSAKLRLGRGDPYAKVDEVIRLLDLHDVQDAMIGSPEGGDGLSLEARKRVTIGVELVTEPKVLFMDEPTSGLDTAGALAVLNCARAVADSGRTVVMTIHQPSTELFEMFDALCLLQKGGRTAYCGPIHAPGERAGSRRLLDYFQRNAPDQRDQRYRYTDDQNPADFMLNVLGYAGEHWTDGWARSAPCQELNAELAARSGAQGEVVVPPPASCMQQTCVTLKRNWLTFWRTPTYNVTRNIFATFTGLLLGSSYWNLGDTQKDLQNFVTVIFFTVVLGVLNTMNALPVIINGRSTFYREVASGTYSETVYAITLAVVEIPFFLASTLIFVNIMYWMCGFPSDAETYGFFLVQYFLFVAFTVYFGQMIAALSPSLMIAQILIPVFVGIWSLFNGFLITFNAIPDYFIEFYYVNPYVYFLRAMVANILLDKPFHCADDEWSVIEWNPQIELLCNPTVSNGTFGPSFGAFGDNTCGICPFTSGTRFLSFYGWDTVDKWADTARLASFVVAARIISTLLLKYKRHIQR